MLHVDLSQKVHQSDTFQGADGQPHLPLLCPQVTSKRRGKGYMIAPCSASLLLLLSVELSVELLVESTTFTGAEGQT